MDYIVRIIDGFEVLLDKEDEHLLDSKGWRIKILKYSKYLRRETRVKGVKYRFSFHRLITKAKVGQIVDHINGNSLDNRKSNLRFVTALQNTWNRATPKNSKSRFNGVGWSCNRWQVSIRNGVKQIYIGRYKSEIEAAYNYDLASLKYHGEYGRRNFLPLISN